MVLKSCIPPQSIYPTPVPPEYCSARSHQDLYGNLNALGEYNARALIHSEYNASAPRQKIIFRFFLILQNNAYIYVINLLINLRFSDLFRGYRKRPVA